MAIPEVPSFEDIPDIPEIDDDDDVAPAAATGAARTASASEFDTTHRRIADVRAEAPPRDDPTTLDPSLGASIRASIDASLDASIRATSDAALERGDPTAGVDAARAPASAAPSARQRLRTIAQLQRRRGIGGDMRYVVTAIFGVRRTRRELAALEATQATRQKARRRHLVTLGRTAASADGFAHAALGAVKEQLRAIEEERARHAGQVATADGELERFTRARNDAAAKHAAEVAAVDARLAELGKQLEPLEKDGARATRRAADLRDGLRRIGEQIAAAEASLPAATPEQRGAIEAEIASLVAERTELRHDEPALAGALDGLQPRIAALDAARTEARARRAELDEAEQRDQRRTAEVLAAIGAKRVVVDRAASDAETRRDKVLFELGERLYVDRPDDITAELSPIDAIDLELGTGDRRTMELREILSSVDRMKIVRGAALWILLLGALGLATGWVLRAVL